MTNTPLEDGARQTLLLRTIAAGLVLGAAGWAMAHLITVIFATIALPALDRVLLPKGVTFGMPAGWSPSTTWAWTLCIVGVVLIPFLFNPTWISRRLLSVAGIIKLVIATLLVVGVAMAGLIASDSFTDSAWAGGASRSLLSQLSFVLVAAACGAALFALFGQGMRRAAPDRWSLPAASPADVKRALAAGFIAATIVSLLAFVVSDALGLLVPALFGFLGESAEVSPLGWQRLELGFALGLGLLLASCGALLVAMSPGRVDRVRRLSSVAVAILPAIAAVGLSLWFKNFCRTTGEMGMTFTQAAGLESPPKPRLMVLSGASVVVYPMETKTLGSGEVIGATSRNIQLAEQYLRGHGSRWTTHTLSAWHVAPSVHDQLLEPEAAIRARIKEAEGTGSLMASMMVMAKVPTMPRSEAARDVSALLRDPAHFTAGAKATVRLQGEALVPHDRAVSGSIKLPAGMAQGARVGLYRQSDAHPQSGVLPPRQLVAAAAPDANGKFAFDSLPPAFYSVGVLLPEAFGSDPARVTVQGALRIVDLSKDRRRDDAGSITVVLK